MNIHPFTTNITNITMNKYFMQQQLWSNHLEVCSFQEVINTTKFLYSYKLQIEIHAFWDQTNLVLRQQLGDWAVYSVYLSLSLI